MNQWMQSAREQNERIRESVEKLFTVAQPGTVFGEPVRSEGYTVIPTNEVMVGMGIGFGGGTGSGPRPENAAPDAAAPSGTGGGGGGGGGAQGRPVAVVVISPQGVEVKPVVDATKVAITLFTAMGAMWIALGRMRQMARRG
jgi:uncharacterized spore protein YtfJ